ncbi:alkyl sulfatase dimerization domain-containing protein [uncultured Pseudoteredinibacter sp.]|uniref:alkyl sulfatase dimerization domain-containing protein n=1 Tax=uncultured Pseudoteredinibacter sp. TaxID=1641701 RepID=UPI0026052FA1|nr:alkyl sulfatase dimerization domain-containing protein [uncultured Pseudoteredinibacter sp.]
MNINTLFLRCFTFLLMALTTVAFASTTSPPVLKKSKLQSTSLFPVKPSVHPNLIERGKKAEQPQLIKINDRIHQAFAYDFSNIFFIEGDDGIIVIDSGWSAAAAQRVLEDYRQISQKPIVALIYTHGHGDHLGGAKIFVNEQADTPVDIYAAGSWQAQQKHFNTALSAHVTMRAAAQLGALLPDGEHGRVNIGVGKMQIKDVHIEFVPPTKEIQQAALINIAGVPIELTPIPSETIDQLFIWLPEDKVMHAADVAASTLPILSTPRNEPDRSPLGFIDAMEFMMSKPIEHLVAGHSLPIAGNSQAMDALLVQRDAAQFIYDQTIRALNMNLGPREAAEFVKLPKHLSEHPLLSESYHRVAWIVRGLYSRYGGWFSGDSVDLNPLEKAEEAKRIIQLAGGSNKLLDKANKAFKDKDYQWSAQLANYLLLTERHVQTAKALKVASLKAMAYNSASGNQRHYMLSDAMALQLGIGSEQVRNRPRSTAPLKPLAAKELLRLMGPQLNPALSLDKDITVAMNISNADKSVGKHFITVRHGIFQHSDRSVKGSDVTVTIDRATLERLLALQSSWSKEMATGKVHITGNPEAFKDFLASFDFSTG